MSVRKKILSDDCGFNANYDFQHLINTYDSTIYSIIDDGQLDKVGIKKILKENCLHECDVNNIDSEEVDIDSYLNF